SMGQLRPSIFCGCIAFFIIGLAGIASMNQSLLAADSLQVSGQTNKLTMPQSGPSGAAPSQPFNPFKRDSSAPAAFDDAPTILPSNQQVGRNRHFEELRDRQMNWIFLTPETFNKGPNPADMFDKQEEPAGPSAGNSKVIENFWKEQDHQNGIDSPLSARSRRKADDKDTPALAEPSGSLSPRLSQEDAALNWNGLFRQKEQKETANRSLPPAEGIFGGLFNAPMDESAGLSG